MGVGVCVLSNCFLTNNLHTLSCCFVYKSLLLHIFPPPPGNVLKEPCVKTLADIAKNCVLENDTQIHESHREDRLMRAASLAAEQSDMIIE